MKMSVDQWILFLFCAIDRHRVLSLSLSLVGWVPKFVCSEMQLNGAGQKMSTCLAQFHLDINHISCCVVHCHWQGKRDCASGWHNRKTTEMNCVKRVSFSGDTESVYCQQCPNMTTTAEYQQICGRVCFLLCLNIDLSEAIRSNVCARKGILNVLVSLNGADTIWMYPVITHVCHP